MMVCELSDAERNLHLSRLMEALVARAPTIAREAIYREPEALAALRAGALAGMLIENAMIAARLRVPKS